MLDLLGHGPDTRTRVTHETDTSMERAACSCAASPGRVGKAKEKEVSGDGRQFFKSAKKKETQAICVQLFFTLSPYCVVP
jgi:hypothetical protein